MKDASDMDQHTGESGSGEVTEAAAPLRGSVTADEAAPALHGPGEVAATSPSLQGNPSPADAPQTYILHPDVALRSWERVPYAYVRRFETRPRGLTRAEFEVAQRCDATTPLEMSPELEKLVRDSVVRACEPGAHSLTAWQRHRACPNRVMPWIGLEITARCNYNCIHCFNVSDNARMHDELSFEQVERLLDEAYDAGVQAVLITGGEPLVHPRFFDIMEAVYARDMFVHELNTNGRLLTQPVLERLSTLPFRPQIKISFDGVGYHDWMRTCPGAEQDALRAIRASVEAGFDVRVQTNVNRKNRASIPETLNLLDSMGAHITRLIRTTPSPRWEMNAAGQCMDWAEYLARMLDVLAGYAASEHAMEVDAWHLAVLSPKMKAFRLSLVHYNTSTFKTTRPCCTAANGMASVGADGQVWPCMQCSGWMGAHGITLGNALDSGLASILHAGPYYNLAHTTVADKLRAAELQPHSPERSCAECPWLTWCAGGCPAMAMLSSGGDIGAPDPACCEFYFNAWPDRFEQALPGWRNMTPLV